VPDYTVKITLAADGTPAISEVNKVDDRLKKLGDDGKTTGDKTAGSLGGIEKAAKAIGVAFAAWELFNKAGELNELGQAANAAERTFVQLAGGETAAANALTMLRSETRGVVDDTTLMTSANRMLMMNLAGTTDQAAELTGMAVSLAKAMGTDAATGAADFAAMLANQSIPRLDTFGISSGAVRERMLELKAAGHDAQEAFTMATLEEGRQALERLGPTLDAAATGTEKLATMWEILSQNVGQAINTTLNQAATTLDQMVQIGQIQGGNHPDQIAATARAQEFVNTYFDVLDSELKAKGVTFDSDAMAQVLGGLFTAIENDPTILDSRDRMMEFLTTIPEEYRGMFADSAYNTFAAQEVQRLSVVAAEKNAKTYNDAYNAALVGMYSNAGGGEGAGSVGGAWAAMMERNAEAGARRAAERQSALAGANEQYQGMVGLYEGLGDVPGGTRSDDALATYQTALDDAQSRLEDLKEQFDDGLIGEKALNNAEEMVDSIQQMRDDAKEFQDFINNASLDEMLGVSSGGRMGEMFDKVLEEMQSAGASEEEIAAAQEQFDMASGRQNRASNAVEDTMTAIAQLDPQDAIKATENLNAFLEFAAQMGFTDQQIAAGIRGATGVEGVGNAGSFTVGAGDTVSGLAAQYGLSPDQIMQAAGITNPRALQPGSYGYGQGAAYTPGFDVNQYNQGFLSLTQGGGYSMYGQGANVGSNVMQDPASLDDWYARQYGGVGMGGVPGAESADPFADMSETSTAVSENASAIETSMSGISDRASEIVSKFDELATPRSIPISVQRVGDGWDLLVKIAGSGILVGGTGGASGSGSPGTPGDGRVGQVPYQPS
jgi:hypothetical protein